jgi:hypothetical protein
VKQNVLGAVLAFGLAALLEAQTAPRWYLDKEAQYPAARYIAAVGEGDTRAAAETAATAAVSLFFNTVTAVRNEAIREFNEAVINDTTDFSKKTYISENAVIRSEEEFLGVRFADPYLDQKRGSWAVLAYIDRQDAARIYESKIGANMTVINALIRDAEGETEDLYVCGLLFRALRLAGLTEEYIKTAIVVDPQARGSYEASIGQIQRLRSLYRSKRGALLFSVTTNGTDSTGRVERTLEQLLEGAGYTITGGGAPYTVSARLTVNEEALSSGVFFRSGIAVRIERENRALFSYSRNYPRYGHQSRDGALNRMFMAIEKDLEENFIPKLTAMLGGA